MLNVAAAVALALSFPGQTPPAPIQADGWIVVKTEGEPRLPDGRPTLEVCGWEQTVIVESVLKRGDLKRATLRVACKKDETGALVAAEPRISLAEDDAAARPVLDADIRIAIESNQGKIQQCQRRDPQGRGLLNLRFKVAPDGTTTAIEVLSSTLKSKAISDCVVAEIATWRFATHNVLDGVPVDSAFGFDGPASDALKERGAVQCKAGEKPKKPEELKEGEIACVEKKARPCAQGEKPLPKDKVPAGELACEDPGTDRGVPFLKGELTHFGDVQLVNVKSSAGVGIGLATIDNVYFAQLRPDLNLNFGPFHLGLGAPLRFEIANLGDIRIAPGVDPTEAIFANAGRFRTEDWDQVEDFLRPIRYLTWGHKEERLYIDLNRVHSVTLGHGQLVRRYTPNVDIDEDRLIAAVDGYTDIGGVELLAGPFPIPRVAGGLLFVKPLGAFFDDTLAKSWSIGVTYVTDLNVPTVLEQRNNPADGRPQLAVDATNQLVWQGRENPVGDTVQGVGVDTELKVLKLDFLDTKVYADYSHLFFPADRSPQQAFEAFNAGGFTVGTLLRMSFGETPVRPIDDESDDVKKGRAPREMKAGHAVRLRLEGRAFDARYLPSYFNTMYEIDRLQYGVAEGVDRARLPTKIGFLASQVGEPLRTGVYTELSYNWVDVAGVTVVYEDAFPVSEPTRTVGGRNFALHAETGGGGFLQLFATYHYRNFEDFGQLFSFNTDNEILYGGGRIELLPILFVNVAVQRSFRVGFDDDDLSRQVDSKGLRFSSLGFQNVWAGTFDVELGWQF